MFFYYLQLGFRQIKNSPVLSAFIVLAIALGIGVSMTMLSLYHALTYNPAEEKSEQLYAVQLAAYGEELDSWGQADGLPIQVTHQDAMNLRKSTVPDRQTPFYAVNEVVERKPAVLEKVTDPGDEKTLFKQYGGRVVDNDFFDMFGLEFVAGGSWSEQVDKNPAYDIVISESLRDWAFAEQEVLGKTLKIEGFEFTVVGVFKAWNPQPFYVDLTNGNFPEHGPAFFYPYSLTLELEFYPYGNIMGWQPTVLNEYKDFAESEYIWQLFWVEMKDQETVEAYRDFLAGYTEEQQQLGRFTNPQGRGQFRSVSEWLSYNQVVNEDNKVLLGLSLMFLLVCLVNTVALLLAKFLRNLAGAGVRRALGASKLDIFCQYLIEVSVLGGIGGFIGVVFAIFGLWGVRLLYPEFSQIAYLNFSMLLMAVVISLLASLLSGFYPALRVCQTQPSVFLKTQ